MAESKFADPPGAAESKFAEPDFVVEEDDDDDESKQHESKFAGDDEDPEVSSETALTTATGVFGKDPIVGKLVEFWGQSLAVDINTFFADNCFQFDVDDKEHKLVYTKVHKKYEKIMEGHLQSFREEEGITESEMYARIRKSTDENELAQMIVELVLCCADFECFVDIMKSKQRQIEHEEAQGAQACESKC